MEVLDDDGLTPYCSSCWVERCDVKEVIDDGD